MSGFKYALALSSTLLAAPVAAQDGLGTSPAECTINDNILVLDIYEGDFAGQRVAIDFGNATERTIAYGEEVLELSQTGFTDSPVIEQAYGTGEIQSASLINKGIFEGNPDKYRFVFNAHSAFMAIGIENPEHIDHIEFTTTVDGRIDNADAFEDVPCTVGLTTGKLEL